MPYKNKEDLYKYQINRWRKRKIDAITYKGGKCVHCGYDNHPAAMQFHHIGEKDLEWNKMRTRSWDKVLKELDKCILLCANCHFIEHSKSKYD